jgi:DNA-binding transcriptional regulator YdaS (Cro superfamily)
MAFKEKIAELNAQARILQIEEEKAQEEAEKEKDRKNTNFYMFYKTKESSAKVRSLIKKNPVAAMLFMFLAEQADRNNAVVASGKALASLLEVSEATISRALKVLTTKKEDGEPAYLEILKSGGTNVFILNPEIVWSAWRTGKDYCLFGNAKILLSTDEQDVALKKRLTVLIEKVEQKHALDNGCNSSD